jgi:hypothetical protein
VLSGCGGSDDSASPDREVAAYRAGAIKAGNKFKSAVQTGFAPAQSGQTLAQKLTRLDVVKSAITKAADDYAALKPPNNLKADNAHLVAQLRDFATAVGEFRTALERKDRPKLLALAPKLRDAPSKIGQTLMRIESKIGPT